MFPGSNSTSGVRPPGVSLAEHWQAISREAERCLGTSSYAPLRGVSCEFREGVLTLRGKVSSFYLKQLAQSLVAKTAGVEVVVNNLEVHTAER